MIKQRNNTLDIMKGLGITLVVLYHSIGNIYYINIDATCNGFINMVISFFMPMFFIISGYLVFGKTTNIKWLKDKTVRFIIPIIIFTIISQLYAEGIGTYKKIIPTLINNITIGFPGIIVWYLWCLLLCFGMIFVIENIRKEFKTSAWIICLGTIVLLEIMPMNILGFGLLKWYGIFFLIGYLMKGNINKISKIQDKVLIPIGIVMFPLIGYSTNWLKSVQFKDYNLGLANISQTIIHRQEFNLLILFIMALLGSLFIYSLSKIVNKIKYVRNIFIYFGIISIAIYLIAIFFTKVTNNFIINSGIGILVAIIIYEVFKKNKFTRRMIGI